MKNKNFIIYVPDTAIQRDLHQALDTKKFDLKLDWVSQGTDPKNGNKLCVRCSVSDEDLPIFNDFFNAFVKDKKLFRKQL